MDRRVTIELFGQNYTFEARGEARRAQKVAEFVQQQVKEAEAALDRLSGVNRVAIMTQAALNIADQYMELKQVHEEILQRIGDRSSELVRMIDKSIPGKATG